VRIPSLIILLIVLFTSYLAAQDGDYPRPDLTWQTIETPHFRVDFHNGEERTGREVASIAEEIYGPITTMYQHEPDQKVTFVVRDHDDYSNGAAYFYDNKVEIWAPALDFELRGTHPWLQDVVTHEFTHIIQIQTAMKLGRTIPAIYLQWLGYEAERRTDVLYGYPNVIVSYPLSAFVVPSWFAEGVAQYNSPKFQYDYWDSHRDMILRMYMLAGNPLTWEEMAVFGKTSLGNESSYNAGFSIVEYIADTYGVDKLNEISRALSSLPRVTIDGAIAAVLGKSGEELYEEWKKAKTEHYRKLAGAISANRVEGEVIEKEGFGNFYPEFTPDGRKLAYVSNKGEDYFGLSSVYLYDFQTKTAKKLGLMARSTLSFSPDGRYLYYSRTGRHNKFFAKLSDLYRYDLVNEEEERLTYGLRACNPKISPDGKKLVFAYGSDGTVNVGVADSMGKNIRRVTDFTDGEQVFTPVWSPDGSKIAFGYSSVGNQSLAMIDEDGKDFRLLVSGPDSRNPSFSRDGKSLFYASDETGIYNIYELDLQTGARRQVTNVLGGAFLPATDDAGDLAFASYTVSGYKIAFLERSERIAAETKLSAPSTTAREVESSTPGSGAAPVASPMADATVPTFSSGALPPVPEPKPYKSAFTSMTIIPVLRVDNYNPRNKGLDVIRPGIYFSSSEMLDKISLFGGAVINRQLERDLFAIFEYRDAIPPFYQLGLAPTLSLELYNISRKTGVSFPMVTDRQYLIQTDVTYDLFEIDASLKQKMVDDHTQLQVGYALSRYDADIGAFLLPTVGVSPAFRNTYLIGNALTVQLMHENIHPSVDQSINPVGRTVSLTYSYEFNKFNPEGEYNVENGVLVPRYSKPSFHRLDVQWTEHLQLPIPKHTLTLSARGSSILKKGIDEFFNAYAGGFIGMRGYPYYSLGGSDLAVLSAAYRFPLWTTINFRFAQFYFTKLYGSVFGDLGDAWTTGGKGSTPSVGDWKKDAGLELRLEAFSFYQYPTRIFFAGAYGFDRFSQTFNNVDVTYGREWRFYFGVLFGFDLNPMTKIFQRAEYYGR
jgi:Tol biopolymer transport system component